MHADAAAARIDDHHLPLRTRSPPKLPLHLLLPSGSWLPARPASPPLSLFPSSPSRAFGSTPGEAACAEGDNVPSTVHVHVVWKGRRDERERSTRQLVITVGRHVVVGRWCMHEQEEERRRRRRKRRWGRGSSAQGKRRRADGGNGCALHGRRPPRGVGLGRLLRLVSPFPPALPVPQQPDRRPFR